MNTIKYIEVLMENHPITFKVDTSAEVTALSDTTFHSLKNPELQLTKSNQTHCGSNHSPHDMLGKATFKLTSKDKLSRKRVFVIHNLQPLIISVWISINLYDVTIHIY